MLWGKSEVGTLRVFTAQGLDHHCVARHTRKTVTGQLKHKN